MKHLLSLFVAMIAAVSALAGNEYHGSFVDDGSGKTSVPGAQITGIVPTTVGGFGAGASNARGLGAIGGTYQMSPANGSGNYLLDMFSVANSFPGQIGVTYTPGHTGLWFSQSTTGTGTNAWGYPVDLFGGANFGNQYWYDLPNSGYQNMGFYFGFGTNNSSWSNAWPSGTNSGSVQPGLIVANGNPASDGAYISIKGTSTNSARGSLIGHGYDEFGNLIPLYMNAYGLTIFEMGDAGTPNPAYGQLGLFAYQAPSHNFIGSDLGVPFYFTENWLRGGDSTNGINVEGQVPLFVIDTGQANQSSNVISSGAPFNTALKWDFRQPGGLPWTIGWNQNTGAVVITNGALTTTNVTGIATNKAAYQFGNNGISGNGSDGSAMFNVNGTAVFNELNGGNGMIVGLGYQGTFHTFGMGFQDGQYAGLISSTARPIKIYQSTSSDIVATLPDSQTWIEMGGWDANKNFYSLFNVNVAGTVTATNGFIGNGSGLTNLSANAPGITISNSFSLTNLYPNIGNGSMRNPTVIANTLWCTYLTNGPGIVQYTFRGLGATNYNIYFPTNWVSWAQTNLMASLAGTNWIYTLTNGTVLDATFEDVNGLANPNGTNSMAKLFPR